MGALAAEAGAALRESEPALVTVYHGDLDATGHVFGSASDAWYYQLGHVDKLAEQLASAVPPGTLLYVTADHGMVDIAPANRVNADAIADLRKGVALLGGEPRARHVYTEPGAAGDVLAAWREVLGEPSRRGTALTSVPRRGTTTADAQPTSLKLSRGELPPVRPQPWHLAKPTTPSYPSAGR